MCDGVTNSGVVCDSHVVSNGDDNNRIVIVGALRCPIGSFRGWYKDLSTIDIASSVVNAVCAQAEIHTATADTSWIDALYAGVAMPSGLGQAPDKQIVMKAKLPSSVISCTVNKVCASGMKAIHMASNELRLGYIDKCVICVGAESMTNAPNLNEGLVDGTSLIHMGDLASQLADKLDISREMQDNYAIGSYERCIRAWESGLISPEIARVDEVPVLERDEELNRFKPEKIPLLKAAFGTSITAANASALGDGAACLVLCKQSFANDNHLVPIAEVVEYADAANEPAMFGLAPELSIRALAKRCAYDDFADFADRIKLWEINEAFSAVALANTEALQLDPDRVNVDGGAVAIGHPLGMSGARIVVHMAHRLENKGDLGVCSVCNGGGGASTILLRKC